MTQQAISADFIKRAQKRMDDEVEFALKAREHYWHVMQVHRISPDALDRAAFEALIQDTESLRMMMVGCFICEQSWEPHMTRRKCPGPPKDSVNDGWVGRYQ